MNIVYIISTLNKSGPVEILLNIIQFLPSDCKVFIIVLKKVHKETLDSAFESLGAKVFHLDAGRYNMMKTYTETKRIIDDLSPCIVHSHCLKGGIINSIINNKKTFRIHTLHNNYRIEYQYLFPFPLNIIWFYTIISRIKKLDCLVACSNSVHSDMNRYFTCSKFISITNGVDINKYYPATKEDIDCLKTDLKWAPKKIHLLVCCRITRVKNIKQIIDALVNLEQDFHLIVLGTGDCYEYYRKNYNAEGKIEFRGFLNDPLEYIQSADYFVSASRLEGFSCSVLESLACGTPTILSNISSHTLFKENIGYNQCISYFELDKTESLRTLLSFIRDHKIILTRKSAREFVSNNYSAQKMSGEYYELYKNGLNRLQR